MERKMIRFYCRGCSKEMWTYYFEDLKDGKTQGETIDELWRTF